MIRREGRNGGESRGNEEKENERGLRKRAERERKERYKRELRLQFELEEEEDHHLLLLVVQLPQVTAVLLRSHEFLTRFCSKELQ